METSDYLLLIVLFLAGLNIVNAVIIVRLNGKVHSYNNLYKNYLDMYSKASENYDRMRKERNEAQEEVAFCRRRLENIHQESANL